MKGGPFQEGASANPAVGGHRPLVALVIVGGPGWRVGQSTP